MLALVNMVGILRFDPRSGLTKNGRHFVTLPMASWSVVKRQSVITDVILMGPDFLPLAKLKREEGVNIILFNLTLGMPDCKILKDGSQHFRNVCYSTPNTTVTLGSITYRAVDSIPDSSEENKEAFQVERKPKFDPESVIRKS